MWDKIFLEFQKHPRDLCTVPTRGQEFGFMFGQKEPVCMLPTAKTTHIPAKFRADDG